MLGDTREGPDAPPGWQPRANDILDARRAEQEKRAEAWLRHGRDQDNREPSPGEWVLEELDLIMTDHVIGPLVSLLALYEEYLLDMAADVKVRAVIADQYPAIAAVFDPHESSPRHPDPRCKECGERLGDAERAEVYLDPDYLRRHAGGQDVLVDDIPDDAFGPYLVHQDPCYTGNRERYDLA